MEIKANGIIRKDGWLYTLDNYKLWRFSGDIKGG